MVIQKATMKDFQGIHQIFQEVHDLHLAGTINVFKEIDPFTEEEFTESLKNKDELFLIAKDEEDNVLGFLRAIITEREGRLTKFKRTLHIDSLGVKRDNHNKGVGTSLMEEIKRIAKKEKCDNIILDVWSFNDNALSFYKHQGFKTKRTQMEINF